MDQRNEQCSESKTDQWSAAIEQDRSTHTARLARGADRLAADAGISPSDAAGLLGACVESEGRRPLMTFTEIAAAYSRDYEGRIIGFCDAMEWQELTPLPMMQGEGIKAAIRRLRLPRVSHVGYSNAMVPYGLYGIKCRYSNGPAEIFLLDIGTHILVLCHRLLAEGGAR